MKNPAITKLILDSLGNGRFALELYHVDGYLFTVLEHDSVDLVLAAASEPGGLLPEPIPAGLANALNQYHVDDYRPACLMYGAELKAGQWTIYNMLSSNIEASAVCVDLARPEPQPDKLSQFTRAVQLKLIHDDLSHSMAADCWI